MSFTPSPSHVVLAALVLLLGCGSTRPALVSTPTGLTVTHLTYVFVANTGGENGAFAFGGSNFDATTTAGTDAAWIANALPISAGDVLIPTTNFYLGEGCGHFQIDGATYPWGDCADLGTVRTNMAGFSGQAFTFPALAADGPWTLTVPASLTTWDGAAPWISYGTPEVTKQLTIGPGTLALTWNYQASEFRFVDGTFSVP